MKLQGLFKVEGGDRRRCWLRVSFEDAAMLFFKIKKGGHAEECVWSLGTEKSRRSSLRSSREAKPC
jgi:hypothetical protein